MLIAAENQDFWARNTQKNGRKIDGSKRVGPSAGRQLPPRWGSSWFRGACRAWPQHPPRRSHPAAAGSPLFQVPGELILAKAIEDTLLGHAPFAGHLDAPVRQVDFAGGMRVRIDTHHAA